MSKLFERLRRGESFEAASRAAGVSSRTVRGWLAAGRAEGATPEQRDFAEAVDRLRAG